MRTVKTLGIHFWVNKQKEINGEVLLYARVTIDMKRVNISSKRKVPIELWDFKQRKMVGNSAKAKEINEYLEITKSELYNKYQILRSDNRPITAENLKNEFLREAEDSKTLKELIKYHNLKIENTHAIGSIRNFSITIGYVNRFLKKKKLDDIFLSELNFEFLCDFENFLNAFYPNGHPKAMSHNTVTKHIQRLRKIVTLAYNLECIKDDPFRRWKSSFDK